MQSLPPTGRSGTLLHKRIVFGNLEVLHRVNPRMKHCYVAIERDGSVVLKSPRISEREALRILAEKSAWIEKKLRELAGRNRLEHRPGEEVSYFGEVHPLAGNDAFDDLRGALQRLRERSDGSLQRCYDGFYKRRAGDHIPERLAHFEKLCGRSASSLRIRKMRSRWGSCSSRGAITINSMVMRLPEVLIDYIIVHELSHLEHMNHSKAFYATLARTLPGHRKLEAELRGYQLL